MNSKPYPISPAFAMYYRDFLFPRIEYYCSYRQHQSAAEIRVDKQMRTSVPHIFAIGGLAGRTDKALYFQNMEIKFPFYGIYR
jgi:hypothetical protein